MNAQAVRAAKEQHKLESRKKYPYKSAQRASVPQRCRPHTAQNRARPGCESSPSPASATQAEFTFGRQNVPQNCMNLLLSRTESILHLRPTHALSSGIAGNEHPSQLIDCCSPGLIYQTTNAQITERCAGHKIHVSEPATVVLSPTDCTVRKGPWAQQSSRLTIAWKHHLLRPPIALTPLFGNWQNATIGAGTCKDRKNLARLVAGQGVVAKRPTHHVPPVILHDVGGGLLQLPGRGKAHLDARPPRQCTSPRGGISLLRGLHCCQ